MNYCKICFFIFMFSNLFIGKHTVTCEVNPQKYVIYGTFVIEQDSIINIEEKDPETYKNPNIKRPIIDDIFTPTTHGNVINPKKRPRGRCSCVVCEKPRTHRTVKTQTLDSTLSPGW